jgi:hypothetical protein
MFAGVPRAKRGDVWHFLAEQYCLKVAPIDTSKFPNYHVSYENLLRQLTSHQHAILIDLGKALCTPAINSWALFVAVSHVIAHLKG